MAGEGRGQLAPPPTARDNLTDLSPSILHAPPPPPPPKASSTTERRDRPFLVYHLYWTPRIVLHISTINEDLNSTIFWQVFYFFISLCLLIGRIVPISCYIPT
jgi:hypothetical protein